MFIDGTCSLALSRRVTLFASAFSNQRHAKTKGMEQFNTAPEPTLVNKRLHFRLARTGETAVRGNTAIHTNTGALVQQWETQ